jgi:hypothetical protein
MPEGRVDVALAWTAGGGTSASSRCQVRDEAARPRTASPEDRLLNLARPTPGTTARPRAASPGGRLLDSACPAPVGGCSTSRGQSRGPAAQPRAASPGGGCSISHAQPRDRLLNLARPVPAAVARRVRLVRLRPPQSATSPGSATSPLLHAKPCPAQSAFGCRTSATRLVLSPHSSREAKGDPRSVALAQAPARARRLSTPERQVQTSGSR